MDSRLGKTGKDGGTGSSGAATVTRAIRDDIIRGVHAPGARLAEEALSARYGVSRVPVREALRTLEAEGFVARRPYAGVVVAELDDAEAEDLIEIRSLLEPLGAARAAIRHTPEQLGRLKELVALAEDALAAGRLDELARLNSRFHEVLAQASGSRTLAELITQLRWKMEWVYTAKLPRRAQDSWREHREIVEVLESGDPDKAARVVSRHIDRSRSGSGSRSVSQGAHQPLDSADDRQEAGP